jgi:ATP-dependent DNA ligase
LSVSGLKFALIVEAMLAARHIRNIDGEGVVAEERGVTDFERLRAALAERGGSRAAFLYGFDLLALDGEDLCRHPGELRTCNKSLRSSFVIERRLA